MLLCMVASALIRSVPLKNAKEYHEVPSSEPVDEGRTAAVPALETNKPARKGDG